MDSKWVADFEACVLKIVSSPSGEFSKTLAFPVKPSEETHILRVGPPELCNGPVVGCHDDGANIETVFDPNSTTGIRGFFRPDGAFGLPQDLFEGGLHSFGKWVSIDRIIVFNLKKEQ